MKNRKAKAFLTAMVIGSLVFGSSVYVYAEADAAAETQDTAEDSAQILVDPILGGWAFGSDTDVDLFGADGKLYEKTTGDYEEIGDYTYTDNVLTITMTADGSEGMAVEAQLVPYDASKLELEYTEDKFYLDQMLEMTVSLTDTSDPMNASTESQTVYGVKYKNQKDFVMRTISGYTWTTAAGDLAVGEDGSLVLTTLEGTTNGTLSSDDGETFNFTWDGGDAIPYIYAGVTDEGLTFLKAADTTQSIVLSNGVKTN